MAVEGICVVYFGEIICLEEALTFSREERPFVLTLFTRHYLRSLSPSRTTCLFSNITLSNLILSPSLLNLSFSFFVGSFAIDLKAFPEHHTLKKICYTSFGTTMKAALIAKKISRSVIKKFTVNHYINNLNIKLTKVC